jgi:hypothetical protein
MIRCCKLFHVYTSINPLSHCHCYVCVCVCVCCTRLAFMHYLFERDPKCNHEVHSEKFYYEISLHIYVCERIEHFYECMMQFCFACLFACTLWSQACILNRKREQNTPFMPKYKNINNNTTCDFGLIRFASSFSFHNPVFLFRKNLYFIWQMILTNIACARAHFICISCTPLKYNVARCFSELFFVNVS